MGSVQQVAMASVCLVAAFAFGSYINQSQNDQSKEADASSPDGLHSLIESDSLVQSVPDNLSQIKPKLSPRYAMPSLSHNSSSIQSDFAFSQPRPISGVIPPPSDLTGRKKPSQNSLASSFSLTPKSSGLATDAPSFAPEPSGESSMPTITRQNLGSSPNLADSMRPFQTDGFDRPRSTVESAPVFAPTELTAQTSPIDQPVQQPNQRIAAPVIANAPSFPNLNQRSQTFTAAKPTLPEHQMSSLNSITNNSQTQRPTVISEPVSPYETATRDQFRFSSPQQGDTIRNQDRLTPIPSLKQTVTIDDPGGAFGNRDSRAQAPIIRPPQSDWSNSNKSVINQDDSVYYPELAQRQQQQQPPQQRVNRLPLRLNSNAESKLTRLRNNTIQKISLNTTQFSEHVVERGDSLQSIATRYFGKPDYYLDIYLANRDRLRFPGDLREGMSLKIPIYQQ